MKQSYNTICINLEKYKSKFMQATAKLDVLSPLKTLSRGYSIVQNKNGNVITKIKEVSKNDELFLTLTDGKVNVIAK